MSCLVAARCHVVSGCVVYVMYSRVLLLYCVALCCRVRIGLCRAVSCIAMHRHAMHCIELLSLALSCLVIRCLALSCLRTVVCCHVLSCHASSCLETSQNTTRHGQIRHGKGITTSQNDNHTAFEGLSLSSLPARGRPTLQLGLHHASTTVTVCQPRTRELTCRMPVLGVEFNYNLIYIHPK